MDERDTSAFDPTWRYYYDIRQNTRFWSALHSTENATDAAHRLSATPNNRHLLLGG